MAQRSKSDKNQIQPVRGSLKGMYDKEINKLAQRLPKAKESNI